MLIGAPIVFHARLPGYQPTPLRRLPELASRWGIGEVLLKDESNRCGLPAFKILGASWAAYRAVVELIGDEPRNWSTIDEFRERIRSVLPLRIVTATDGNYGRAVARVAALFGFEAQVFVPAGTAEARITAIESEGATVEVVNGTYDETVAHAAQEQADRSLVIQDTSWPGYEKVPRWVMEGYSTIFLEIQDALSQAGESEPTLVVVQIGVGGLAAAAVSHFRRPEVKSKPTILGVEPVQAACALAAIENDRIVTIPGPHDSIMAGLNCGTVASVAWPFLRTGVEAIVAIEDDRARQAMRELAPVGVISGESGSAGFAGLLEVLSRSDKDPLRRRLGISGETRVLLISTEGPTDPVMYEKIVGRSPALPGQPKLQS